ncbi:50S ribosomal protein L10 [Candidatus Hodarchaeum mangrovi]
MAAVIVEEKKLNNKKVDQVNAIVDLATKYSVIGLADLSGISSKALQGIRSSMRSGDVQAVIKVAKNTLKSLAFGNVANKSNKEIKNFIPHIVGSCALIFTNSNPFTLQKFLNQNQVPAPAKVGQVSPVEVYVQEGSTNLDPGPIISDLGSLGIQTRIEKGKIRIIKTTKVLSIGETVSETHAAILARLGILPFKVGLKLNFVFENGEILDGSVLDVDDSKIISDLQQAYAQAFSLAIHPKISYLSKETVPVLLGKAFAQAMALSVEVGYITENTIGMLLIKTTNQATLLKKKLTEKDPNLNI